METLKTKSKIKLQELQDIVCSEYYNLINQEGSMKTAVYDKLKKKYKISSNSTVWRYIKESNKRKVKKNELKNACKI